MREQPDSRALLIVNLRSATKLKVIHFIMLVLFLESVRISL
ncbi:Uncharacterised protein [Serratia fonticola]|uniref:Uncharacterized protein n=1 Tax=Serratia fonticola TaxID=47917 RepID=A0A4U9WPC8_SERFO|nr:Uncharacterised protein [Serratia fonticola]VTR61554.1 Uncharacterised protein [Serratia fonticola]